MSCHLWNIDHMIRKNKKWQYSCLCQSIIYNDKINKCLCWIFKQWNKLLAQRNNCFSSYYYTFALILSSDMKMVETMKKSCLGPSFIYAPNFHVLYISIAFFSLKNIYLFQSYIRVCWSGFWIILYHLCFCIWTIQYC